MQLWNAWNPDGLNVANEVIILFGEATTVSHILEQSDCRRVINLPLLVAQKGKHPIMTSHVG